MELKYETYIGVNLTIAGDAKHRSAVAHQRRQVEINSVCHNKKKTNQSRSVFYANKFFGQSSNICAEKNQKILSYHSGICVHRLECPERVNASTCLEVRAPEHYLPQVSAVGFRCLNRSVISPLLEMADTRTPTRNKKWRNLTKSSRSINQSIDQSIERSIKRTFIQSKDQLINQSIDRSIDQLITQSINQATNHSDQA